MKKVVLLLGLALFAKQTFAATFRSTWNTFLTDYFWPSVAGVLLISVAIGLFQNWNVVTRPETMKQGLINIGIYFGVALLLVAVLVGVATITNQLSNIQI